MIKVTSGKYTFTFNDGTTEEEQQEAIKRHLAKARWFRPIVMHKKGGNIVHLGNGVRKHGKRHTS
jgi:transposase InsO family protein